MSASFLPSRRRASRWPPSRRAGRRRPTPDARSGSWRRSSVGAVVEGDRAFFERVLADDFTHTSHTGVFKTRAEWLAEDKSGAGGMPWEVVPATTPTTSPTWLCGSTGIPRW